MSDSHKILPCSVLLQGEYGYNDVVGGVPVELGIHGIERIVELQLNTEEKTQFERSINSVKSLIEALKNEYF